jgi:hypothetical protein
MPVAVPAVVDALPAEISASLQGSWCYQGVDVASDAADEGGGAAGDGDSACRRG